MLGVGLAISLKTTRSNKVEVLQSFTDGVKDKWRLNDGGV
jgi:hypothetical protein